MTAPGDIIAQARAKGQTVLTEHEAKLFCAGFGVPVCRESVAASPAAAADEAGRLGFPVVLKAMGESLVHKSEVGGVALNLHNQAEVMREAKRLLAIPGCQSLLVQEMVSGHRELVAGLVRDPQFGPCVMFGIGGVLTEVFADVVFRVAPFTAWDARQAVGDIHTQKILGPARGEMAVDLDELARVLSALGKIGLEYPEVRSIDLNPLIIRPNGRPVAVDALVTLDGPGAAPAEEPAENPMAAADLASFFAPESVAVIGASPRPGKAGNDVIRNILANGYPGKLYLVSPKKGNILGLPVYESISALPKGIDLAVIVIPAEATIAAVRDCARQGIRSLVLCASGFSEVGEAGARLQQELIGIVRETGVRVLGPNTAGHVSTPHKFTSSFFPVGKIPPGSISFIAQTGNFATHSLRYIITAEHFGVARVVGLGNKIDIDETEVLEYYAQDPETKAVFMYLESLKRPRRFLEVARRVTRSKPVIMLKGGSTREGSLAAVTHTAALALDERITEGALKQAGIAQITHYSHFFLASRALSMMPLPRGNRVGFLAPSGAMLVVLADLCHRHLGLAIPRLEEATQKRLQDISPPWIRMRNPVDIWPAASIHGIEYAYREAIEALMRDASVDAVVVILVLTEGIPLPKLDFLVDSARRHPEKPLYVTASGDKGYLDEAKLFLEPRGVPTFQFIEEPFEALAILSRCRLAMERPD